jgi:hypothetical protein
MNDTKITAKHMATDRPVHNQNIVLKIGRRRLVFDDRNGQIPHLLGPDAFLSFVFLRAILAS